MRTNDDEILFLEIEETFHKLGLDKQDFPPYMNPDQFGESLSKRDAHDTYVWIKADTGSASMMP